MSSRKKGGGGEGEQPPFIIRKLRARRHGGGHGAWKVAYADFVTSMMALFIVLWAAEQSSEVRMSIAQYFRNPSVIPGRGDASLLPAATGVVPIQQSQSPPGLESDAESLLNAAMKIRGALNDDPALKELSDQVRIEMTPEGLRIQLVEKDDSLLFEIGSAAVKPALTRLLAVVAGVVGKLPNNVVVEGHTDARQYSFHRGAYSNWELSADRANSARRVLETSGLRTRQIVRVVGLADHEPLIPDDRLNAQNRRVSVLVPHLSPAGGTLATPDKAIQQLKRVAARDEAAPPR